MGTVGGCSLHHYMYYYYYYLYESDQYKNNNTVDCKTDVDPYVMQTAVQ